jgi:hypothetical protein
MGFKRPRVQISPPRLSETLGEQRFQGFFHAIFDHPKNNKKR